MNKQKVYLETTMFNYYFDITKEAQPVTAAFFDAIAAGWFDAYTSTYATSEIEMAPNPKRSNMLGLIEKYAVKVLYPSSAITKLAQCYRDAGVIPVKKEFDALHIACASVNGIDLILSYNFKHINKLKTKVMIPVINQHEGYKSIAITQPIEVIDYEIND